MPKFPLLVQLNRLAVINMSNRRILCGDISRYCGEQHLEHRIIL